jgi:hypothetical protein
VDDINNAADTGGSIGKGSVNYSYAIGKYLVTYRDYEDFLNAMAKIADPNSLSSAAGTKIIRSGTSGNYSYTTIANYANKPVSSVNWFRCARYCNWLHNGKPTGVQDATTTENGAYTLNGAISGNAVAQNSGAKYHIPTENEWYKAAYYKSGGTSAGYWKYATQSDSNPGPICANSIGDGIVCLTPTPTVTPTVTPTPQPPTTISFTKNNTETNGCNGDQGGFGGFSSFPRCLSNCVTTDPIGSHITRNGFDFSVSITIQNPQGNTTYQWLAISYSQNNCSNPSSPFLLGSPCWRDASTSTIQFNNACNGYYELWCRVTNNGVVADSDVYFFEHNPVV